MTGTYWRAIETAPKDGHERVFIAGRYPNGIWYVEESYWMKSGGGHWCGRKLEPPTHWMPLPEPPK
jgi:hypothetical protein